MIRGQQQIVPSFVLPACNEEDGVDEDDGVDGGGGDGGDDGGGGEEDDEQVNDDDDDDYNDIDSHLSFCCC